MVVSRLQITSCFSLQQANFHGASRPSSYKWSKEVYGLATGCPSNFDLYVCNTITVRSILRTGCATSELPASARVAEPPQFICLDKLFEGYHCETDLGRHGSDSRRPSRFIPRFRGVLCQEPLAETASQSSTNANNRKCPPILRY